MAIGGEDNYFLNKHRNELTDFALVELMREQISRKIERKKRGNDGWIDYSFPNEYGNNIYQSIAPMLEKDWFWNDFCAAVISDMCKYEFWNYSSVNLINTDETKSVNIQNKNFAGDYKIFAQVNLMEHTNNVINACRKFYERPRATTYLRKLIAVAALLHDVGKHYQMMQSFKIIPENLLPQLYRHQEFSSKYVNKKITAFFPKDHSARLSEVDEVALMVYEHHGIGGNGAYQSQGSADLREIDRMARMIEYTNIKTGRNERLCTIKN